MMTEPVSFVDLASEWLPLKAEALERVARVFEHGQFVMGPEVTELESRLAEDVKVNHALTCSSGTTALQIALMALGIGADDEVILPAFTFAAPLEAVLLLGAKGVLADVDPQTGLIDVDSVAALIGPRTKAILAVSLYGQPADFGKLNELADQQKIPVVEDAAQSYGASLSGRRSGALCTVGCTSFFPTKPLGGAGDGGALFTDDPDLARRMREIRDHGQSSKYVHSQLGINGRLDSISCALLLIRLDGIKQSIAGRQQIAQQYDSLLSEVIERGRLQPLLVREAASSAFAQYTVKVEKREQVIEAARVAGVQVAVHYPTPLHWQPAFRNRISHGSLINTETLVKQVLCLPIYPTLTASQQEHVASVLSGTLLNMGTNEAAPIVWTKPYWR